MNKPFSYCEFLKAEMETRSAFYTQSQISYVELQVYERKPLHFNMV